MKKRLWRFFFFKWTGACWQVFFSPYRLHVEFFFFKSTSEANLSTWTKEAPFSPLFSSHFLYYITLCFSFLYMSFLYYYCLNTFFEYLCIFKRKLFCTNGICVANMRLRRKKKRKTSFFFLVCRGSSKNSFFFFISQVTERKNKVMKSYANFVTICLCCVVFLGKQMKRIHLRCSSTMRCKRKAKVRVSGEARLRRLKSRFFFFFF